MPQQTPRSRFLISFPTLIWFHVLNCQGPNCGVSDPSFVLVGYGLGHRDVRTIVAHYTCLTSSRCLYFRRRLFMRSAKLLGSAALTCVFEALSSPNAS